MDWLGLVILRFLLVSFYHLEGIQDLQDKEKLIIDVYPEIPRNTPKVKDWFYDP